MDANEQNGNRENYYAVCSGGAAESVRQKWGSVQKKKKKMKVTDETRRKKEKQKQREPKKRMSVVRKL